MASAAVAGSPQRSWDGFNVSVGGGASKLDNSLGADTFNSDELNFPWVFIPFRGFRSVDLTAEGASRTVTKNDDWEGFGTLRGGYDHRSGNFVVGVLADFDFYPGSPKSSSSSSIEGEFGLDVSGINVVQFPVADYAQVSSSIELKNVWSIGGRVGYVVSPNLLIYALGGYTQARIDGQVDLSYVSLATGEQTLSLRAPDRLKGYFLGAGGEVKIAPDVALRLEYRYANYDGETRGATATSEFSGPVDYGQLASINAHLDSEIQTVRGAIVLQLGQP